MISSPAFTITPSTRPSFRSMTLKAGRGLSGERRSRRFPLMTVSAMALKLLKGRPLSTAGDVIASIAEAKKIAKHAPDHLAIVEGLSA